MALFNRKATADKEEMSFIDHLEELRGHIIRSVISILVMALVIFIYRNWIFDNIIVGPINKDFVSYKALCDFSHWLKIGDALCMPPVEVTMQSTTFGGQFLSTISMAIVGGIIMAFPYIFWEFWRFVKPALKEKEVKNTRFIIFWVSFFFFCGAAFGYFLLGPFTFNFLAGFQLGTENMIVTRPTFSDYLDNLTNIILGCGLAFELPVLAYILTQIGIITPSFLRATRKYAVVIILIVAAFITPSPDWMSQLIVFIPLFLLYELSILVSARVFKKLEKDEDKEWD
ncbi:MAG: twin arginine-targeting protein translocase TatC [Sphingobacteriia bacterium 24-36-13]|jgi:sec-independent protein translocase protein TatC|uniref:twin-arginine translocase subunit TatC n=1 Tax=Sediminibacterium sp. TaxID=1917865 RepID=UPI000BD53079|nr:twin-arginine translocase subunit TatC [Sediminibacterium sp.]OYY11650.1 MAG: twin arginine-targeting protein translocase TatC [Sphingobacteriia bacterium 35-36-14]OYZ53850.1 MAG: twin arginine-targeting protein translocase TatC [Sphingobacteriia bacterium 24-36-13]OZA64478.1 MAG: twin arginine-targeting protein translocase TatC [Sphingobacteriia bacterium 39-36-14]HQS23650.1 twin-arginine translocase subunit TatC [Sediminibacterium sp.]HQS35575.1 twin-arginine translocase subunit TatC [Sed